MQGHRDLRAELRDECLKGEIFYSLKQARVVIGTWKDHSNRIRRHSALGYRPAAPVTLEALASHLPRPATLQ